jgi:hypothetical protein
MKTVSQRGHRWHRDSSLILCVLCALRWLFTDVSAAGKNRLWLLIGRRRRSITNAGVGDAATGSPKVA